MPYFTPQGDPKIDFEKVSKDGLLRLNKAREIAGITFKITSHYRTPEHSIEVGGLNNDAHTRIPCSAFDIAYSNTYELYIIFTALLEAGYRRLGVNPKNHHIHVDDETSLPLPRIWIEGFPTEAPAEGPKA